MSDLINIVVNEVQDQINIEINQSDDDILIKHIDTAGPAGPAGPQGPSVNLSDNFGFIDYNDSTGEITIPENVWTDVPNNGAGTFTNKTYTPSGVSDVLDTNTGYLDFSDLTLGSQIIVRNDFKIVPDTNNSLLQVRYVLGSGANEYTLLMLSERLDNGSGIEYQKVPLFAIYMGDNNTKSGPGKLQVKLSSSGTLINSGSYINIIVR